MTVPKNKVILSRLQKDVIRILKERMATIAASLRARQDELNQVLADLVVSWRQEYEVPQDWRFDLDELAFIPPEPEGGESDNG